VRAVERERSAHQAQMRVKHNLIEAQVRNSVWWWPLHRRCQSTTQCPRHSRPVDRWNSSQVEHAAISACATFAAHLNCSHTQAITRSRARYGHGKGQHIGCSGPDTKAAVEVTLHIHDRKGALCFAGALNQGITSSHAPWYMWTQYIFGTHAAVPRQSSAGAPTPAVWEA
jgi:hypothetical protein